MERKLRLVKPSDAAPQADGEEAISAEERMAADALRDALDEGGDALAAGLRAAYTPAAIADDDLDAILARAMGDEDATTQPERDAAERLRAELEGEAEIREAAVLRALALAAKPTPLPPEKNDALVEAALFRMKRRATVRRLAPVTMAAVATITALAAGFALFLGQSSPTAPTVAALPATVAPAALIRARSTQELFDAATPFPRSGEESARIDRIAAARASDLRANRFAAWGVR